MHLITDTGELVTPGSVLTAVVGPHAGRRFRYVEVHTDGDRIMVRHTHPHPFRNARAVLHPSVFACTLHEELTRLRHVLNLLHHAWQKVDEGLLMGVIALAPLAVFEAYNGAEVTREFLTHLLGG